MYIGTSPRVQSFRGLGSILPGAAGRCGTPQRLIAFLRFTRPAGSREPVAVFTAQCAVGAPVAQAEVELPFSTVQALARTSPASIPSYDQVMREGMALVTGRAQALTEQQLEEERRIAAASRAPQDNDVRTSQRGSAPAAMTPAGFNLPAAQAYNRDSSRQRGWGVILSSYGEGPGDPGLARAAFAFQNKHRLGTADGKIGPMTLSKVTELRRASMAQGVNARLDPIDAALVLTMKLPGLPDPLTEPATSQRSVDRGEVGLQRSERSTPAPAPAPGPARRTTPRRQPWELTDEQLQAAVAANIQSMKILKWKLSGTTELPDISRALAAVSWWVQSQGGPDVSQGLPGVMTKALFKLVESRDKWLRQFGSAGEVAHFAPAVAAVKLSSSLGTYAIAAIALAAILKARKS